MEPTTPVAPVAAPAAPVAAPAITDAAAPADAAAASADSAADVAGADAAKPEAAAVESVQDVQSDCLVTVADGTSPVALALAGIALLGLVMKLFKSKRKA
jgi:hypothetical protein